MNYLIIGSSHSACVYQAYREQLAKNTNNKTKFYFCSAGEDNNNFDNISIKNGKIIFPHTHQSEDSKPSVFFNTCISSDINDYDKVFIIAKRNLLQANNFFDSAPTISSSLIKAICDSSLPNLRLFKNLDQYPNFDWSKLYFIGGPLPFNIRAYRNNQIHKMIKRDKEKFFILYKKMDNIISENKFKFRNNLVRVLTPPKAALSAKYPFITNTAYGRGDMYHGNSMYGHELIKKILSI